MIERTRNTYLLVVPSSEDVKLLDAAIQKGELGYNKLGANTYLGFFEENSKSAYRLLKDQFGISGEVTWIQLPHGDTTRQDRLRHFHLFYFYSYVYIYYNSIK